MTCGLAIDDGPVVWRALVAQIKPACEMPRSLPWLGVVLHPTAVLAGAALSWLGDAERCIAWTILEDSRVH